MPQPNFRQVHPVDALNTNFTLAYIQDLTNFIAAQASPSIPSEKMTGKYLTYTKADWFANQARERGDSMESAGSGYNLGTSSYNTKLYAIHKDIGDIVRANADSMINLEREAAMFCGHRIALKREKDWQSTFFATSIWDTNKVGGTDFTKWNTEGGSNPIEDIEAGKQQILGVTGLMPNTLILGYKAFRILKHHADIVDRYKYTSANVVTEDLLAAVFGVDRVLVAKGIENTAVENATASYSFTQTNTDALLCHVNPNPGLLSATAMATYVWTGVSDGLGLEVGVSTFPMPELGRRHTRTEAQIAFDHVVIASDLGYFFSTAV